MTALLPNGYTDTETHTELLDLVTFKWLMAGIGWRVDLPRLRSDTDYARVCAQRGLESGQWLLGARAAELLASLPPHNPRTFTLSNSVLI